MIARTAKMRRSATESLTLGAAAAVVVIANTGVVLDNPGEVLLGDLLRPLAASLLLAVAIPAAFFFFGGIFRFVALSFPVTLFAFFKFSEFMGAAEFFGLFGSAAFYAALAGLALICAGATESIRRRDHAKVAKTLFFLSTAIAAGSAVAVAPALSKASPPGDAITDAIAAEAPSPRFRRADLPDVVYLVPDRYGSAETLKTHFSHDNGGFFAELERRGFYVRRDARSNYAKTVSSLASSMNMADLSDLNASMGDMEVNRYPLFRLIRENAAQRIMRGAGYEYHHLGNWWDPSRRNPYADVVFFGVDAFWSKTSEFEKALMRLTPIAQIATDGAGPQRAECARIKNQLDYIADARRKSERPLFLYAHLTIPHDPVTMDENGNCIPHVYYPGWETSFSDYQKAYSGYVTYLNRRLIEIFDKLKRDDPERGLVFVVQADEGPYPKRLQEDGLMVMQDFTEVEIREKFGIINAIYWDAEKYGAPYLTKTPINNWRIILSKISGEEIDLVEDERSWLMYSDARVYDVKDVTAVLEPPAGDRPLQASTAPPSAGAHQ